MLRPRLVGSLLLLASVGLLAPGSVAAQRVLTDAQQVIPIARGKSALITLRQPIERVSVADPAIADPQVITPLELLINGRQIGTTTLIVWGQTGTVTVYTVEVTADAETIDRQLEFLFPGVDIQVRATGNTVILSGQVREPGIARRAVEVAEASGATVINNLAAPSAEQVLLRVRFAEVSRTASTRIGTSLSATNLDDLDPLGAGTDWTFETLADGLARVFLLGTNESLDVIIDALKSRGEFRSLAEPNLLALEGQEATFLAGGEFPFPVVQGSTGAVSITWREFGVRLKFTPRITNTGGIRLRVEPEVSSLDFANGLTLGGFRVPSILTRRASTEVELREGQHLAIAGLLDNNMLDNVAKIPLLGDIPVLGAFFRSRDAQQSRTELLVIVTPHIVDPQPAPPPLPTGEPEGWDWMRGLRPQDLPPARGRP